MALTFSYGSCCARICLSRNARRLTPIVAFDPNAYVHIIESRYRAEYAPEGGLRASPMNKGDAAEVSPKVVIHDASMEGCQQEWVVVLESDAVLPPTFGSVLTHHRSAFVRSDLVWLDARTGTGAGASGCCTVGVAYRTSVLDRLIENFDPHNKLAYWNGYDQKPKPKVNSPTCLTDWYLGNLADYLHLRSRRLGIVQHPKSESEIALLG